MFIVKKCRISFLLFLVMFSHSCFSSPIKSIDNIISSEKFKSIEIFLKTESGQCVAKFILTYTNTILYTTIFSFVFYSVMEKFSIDDSSSSIVRHVKGEGKKVYSFDDYCGDVPIIVKRFIQWFRDPSIYRGLLDKMNLFLVGPPGVGKSYLAEIIADEVGVPSYILDGSTARGGKFRGSGANLIQKAFDSAEKEKNGAIIVIDEFDAICSKGINEDNEAIKKLQVLMDGFESNAKVKVIALSNEPSKLSDAVDRRFEMVLMEKPDLENREKFFSFLINRYIEQEQRIQYPRIENLLKDLASKTENFSQDDMTKVIQSVFIKVKECAADSKIEGESYEGIIEDQDNGKFKIGKEVFLKEINNMKREREVGKNNFLSIEKSKIPKCILHSMYT